MRFADIPGNDILKKTMVAMADSGRVGHAMLLYENEGCGALPLALAYVQYLNCRNRHDGYAFCISREFQQESRCAETGLGIFSAALARAGA